MIEIFRLARLPHAQVRACCARLVAGGWSAVINVQTVGLFTRVSSCPAVQPPLLSIISTFGIIMQNDGFAERWICRPFPGVRVAAIAARRGLTPQHLVRAATRAISTNIKQLTFSARAVNEHSRSFTEKAFSSSASGHLTDTSASPC